MDIRMPEAIQDRPQVNDSRKAINGALEDNRKPSNVVYIKKMHCHPYCYESRSICWAPCWTRVPMDTGSNVVPLSTTSSTWTTSSYMPRMSRPSTHWCYVTCHFGVQFRHRHNIWSGKVRTPHLKKGKLKNTSEISVPEGRIYDLDENYKYLRILQSFGNNDEEVRCKATSEYRSLYRWVLRSKL